MLTCKRVWRQERVDDESKPCRRVIVGARREDLLDDSGFELVKPLTVRLMQPRGPLAAGGPDGSERLDIEVTRGDEAASRTSTVDGRPT